MHKELLAANVLPLRRGVQCVHKRLISVGQKHEVANLKMYLQEMNSI